MMPPPSETFSTFDLIKQFRSDQQQALAEKDAYANLCVISTIGSNNQPKSRTLVLRAIGDDLAIFINKSSPKWSELKRGIALQTYWASTQVQYRMNVSSIEIDKNTVGESWQLRPDIPKKMDWIYKNSFQQSSEVKDLDQLRAEIDKIKNVDDLKATDQATGLILKPEVIERLDLSTEDGIHDRRLYLKEEHHWIEKQLVP